MGYTTKDVSNALDDVSYLLDELNALGSVIGAVPIQDRPTGTDSVYDMLDRIKHAQKAYYLPLIKDLFTKPIPEIEILDYNESFKRADNYLTVEQLLSEIKAERHELIDFLNKLPQKDFFTKGEVNGAKVAIIELLNEMVLFERSQLKQVAERVLSIEPKHEKRR